jgi:hypothetical protein
MRTGRTGETGRGNETDECVVEGLATDGRCCEKVTLFKVRCRLNSEIT